MLIDTPLSKDLSRTTADARRFEDLGYDGLWVGETKHDPFLQVLQAGEATHATTVGTSVAIAFARTPMTLAYTAYDLAQYTSGRFVLGLGSQVKPHIERRFSMPWSRPAARMREFVLAMRAAWAAWENGSKLDFHGDFYRHTLMTPFFAPEPHRFGPPPVIIAGVGPQMTEVAGEVCDGLFFHPFTTSRYLQEVTLPAITAGRTKAGHGDDPLRGFTLAGPAFTCVGRDEEEMATAIAGTKAQIAFYASTPAYRPVLDLHGWGDLQPELTRMTKEGRWADMADAIDDEILHAMAAVGDPQEVARALVERWGPAAQRISLYATYAKPDDLLPELLHEIRALTPG